MTYKKYPDEITVNNYILKKEPLILAVPFDENEPGGPVPLPTKKEVVTILRAVHKYKDSREQFEQRTHKRLIDVIAPTQKTIEALTKMEMPSGVAVVLKMKEK